MFIMILSIYQLIFIVFFMHLFCFVFAYIYPLLEYFISLFLYLCSMSTSIKTLVTGILEKLSFEKLNPMQEAVIHEGAKGKHLMLLSPTGSGKTLAFLSVLLHNMDLKKEGVQALVIAPSRELALQIESVFRALKSNWKVTCCYGGHNVKSEQNSLAEAPAVIIGTPG